MNWLRRLFAHLRVEPPSSAWEWHIEETYKALITISIEALKLLALVNGGAAVAVLTYLGNLAVHSGHLPNLKPALLWYCGGLLATTLAFVIGYMTQLRLFNEERRRYDGTAFYRLHWIGVWLGILLALFASIAFGFGCYRAASALTSSTGTIIPPIAP